VPLRLSCSRLHLLQCAACTFSIRAQQLGTSHPCHLQTPAKKQRVLHLASQCCHCARPLLLPEKLVASCHMIHPWNALSNAVARGCDVDGPHKQKSLSHGATPLTRHTHRSLACPALARLPRPVLLPSHAWLPAPADLSHSCREGRPAFARVATAVPLGAGGARPNPESSASTLPARRPRSRQR